MKMACYFIFVLTLLYLESCRSIKSVPVESKTDSVVVEKLVEVKLPPDSATIRALLECDENGKIILKWLDIANSKNAKAQFMIDSLGNLLANMKTPSDTVYLPSKTVTVTKKEPYLVEKELTRWQKFRMDAGGWAMGVLLIVIILGVGRIIYNFRH